MIRKYIKNKTHKRIVIVIDRSDPPELFEGPGGDEKPDVLYGYLPKNNKTGKELINCDSFEKDHNVFLRESMLQNSHDCLIPDLLGKQKMPKDQQQKPEPKEEIEEEDSNHIGLGSKNIKNFLCLSFHCYSDKEIPIYLSYSGWTTRFFLRDLKYYLPS